MLFAWYCTVWGLESSWPEAATKFIRKWLENRNVYFEITSTYNSTYGIEFKYSSLFSSKISNDHG
jgi:hypothetical protein